MKRILLILATFCIHYLLVQFGDQFTNPFGFFTAIWPVTGVMLGLYLVYGRWVLVGALLSSLFTLYQNPTEFSLPIFENVVLVFSGIIQLVLSKWLFERFCQLPLKIYVASEIVKSLLLIGPIAVLLMVLVTMPVVGY